MSIRTAPGERRGVRTTIRAGGSHTLFVSSLFFYVCLFCLVTGLCAVAQESSESEEGTGLDTLVEDLNVQGDNLRELVELLATFGETNLNVVATVPQTKVNVILKNKTIREILGELATQYNLYIDYQPGNTLIRPASERPQEELKLIEKDFHLNFSRPSEVEELVTPLLSNTPNAAIQAIDDLKVLRISDIEEAVARIEAFINQIDVPKQSHVFRILYADAEEVASIILERMPDLEEGAITVDVANSQLIVRTTLENLNEIQLLIETLDIRKEIRVFHISFHEVEDVIAVLEDLELLSPEATVAPNEFTGKIIIQDTPERLDRIAEAIRAYDQPRPLVFFEAEILDVNADYNFNWDPTLSLEDSARAITGSSSDDVNIIGDGQTFLELAGSRAFEFQHLEAGDYLAVLQSMESDSDVQTIASPRVLVEMREEARLNVGSEEPFGVRSFRTTLTGVGSDFVTQRVREVGVRLIIYVRNISERGYVEVELGMENSALGGRVDIGGDTQGLRVLTTNVETVAMIKDGRTLAVGGLVQRMESENSGGTPFLNKVPIIRYFFSNLSTQDTRRKLLLFLTPHILNIDSPMDKYRDEAGEDYSVLGSDEFDGSHVRMTSFSDSPASGSQWVNRGGRWGFIDSEGRFVDQTDIFLSAYEDESETSPQEPAPAMEESTGGGPSAKELLDQLSQLEGFEPERHQPEEQPSDQPQPKGSPKTEEPERTQVDSKPVQPATPRPVPKKTKPNPSKFARPLVGQEAMDALNRKADGLGEFQGTLKELILKVHKETGVNPAVSKVEDHNIQVQVNGKGKTYLEVLREALAPHGMMIQRRENRPPLLRSVPKKAPEKKPSPNPQPQSKIESTIDPWNHAGQDRLSKVNSSEPPRKNLSIEEWVAISQQPTDPQPYGTGRARVAVPPSVESWEVPLEVDRPEQVDIWEYRSEYRSRSTDPLEWNASPSPSENNLWDELMSDTHSEVKWDRSPSFSLNRHVKQPVERIDTRRTETLYPTERKNPVSFQEPMYSVPGTEKKGSKIKRFVGRLFGRD